jgi:hypothetical protein
MSSPPTLLSILICDSIIIEKATEKKSLIGIFDVLHSPNLPAVRPMGFFARLTDLEDDYLFVVRVVQLTVDGEKVVSAVETGQVSISDPLGVLDLALNLPPMKFPSFGRYEFQLFANDCYMGRATMTVSEIAK